MIREVIDVSGEVIVNDWLGGVLVKVFVFLYIRDRLLGGFIFM